MTRLATSSPIPVVFQGGSGSQVGGVDAGRIVAARARVQRPFVIGQVDACAELQGKARGAVVAPLVADAAVAIISKQRRPRPARIRTGRAIHARPKSLFQRAHARQSAGARAEVLAVTARNLTGLTSERLTALPARQEGQWGAVASGRAVLALALPRLAREDQEGDGTVSADALKLGNLNGHRAYSSVSGLGRLQPRRGHFASRFYHACRRAFAPIVDAAELDRSA